MLTMYSVHLYTVRRRKSATTRPLSAAYNDRRWHPTSGVRSTSSTSASSSSSSSCCRCCSRGPADCSAAVPSHRSSTARWRHQPRSNRSETLTFKHCHHNDNERLSMPVKVQRLNLLLLHLRGRRRSVVIPALFLLFRF